ncbi:MAG: hypothetical protein EAZ07_02260 [Cytophagales bacterium]|nr:MAG: hypothetical protein EAZ07_02260 [Cytophagales bacterium]
MLLLKPENYAPAKSFIRMLFILFLGTNALFAQKKSPLEYSGFFDSYYHRGPINYTLSIGAVGYSGDLCGGLGCQKFNYNIGIGLNYKVWPRTIIGAEFNYFTLGASDEIKNRNISFTSTNYELVVYGRYYFIEDIVRVAADRVRKTKKIKPYFTLGFGGLLYTPVSTYDAAPSDSVFRNENVGYPGITATFPAGFGIQYVITPRVSIIGELTYRLSLSDYLDDVGAVRGNTSGLKDSYGFFNIKLQVTPSAPAKKKKKSMPVPESTGLGGGSSSANTPPADTNTPQTQENKDSSNSNNEAPQNAAEGGVASPPSNPDEEKTKQ